MKACSVAMSGFLLRAALAAPAEVTTIGTTTITIPTAAPAKTPVCQADNCARAVTGTALGAVSRSAHMSDCASFFSCSATSTLGAPDSVAVTCPTAVPSYASACSGSARFSSACACGGATKTTNFITVTPTITDAPTTTMACPNPVFTECGALDFLTLTYSQVYAGSGTTEYTSNPGAGGQFPVTRTIDGAQPSCAAISDCGRLLACEGYYSFDLHYVNSKKQWECVGYSNEQKNPSYFNETNTDIGAVFGYTNQ